jgi:hypothetical protein
MCIFKENREKLQKGFDTALGGVTLPLENLRKFANSNSQILSNTVGMLNMFTPNHKSSNQVTLSKQEYTDLLNEIKRLKTIESEFNKTKK